MHVNHDELCTNLSPPREGAVCISDHIRLYCILMIRPYHKIKKNAKRFLYTHTLTERLISKYKETKQNQGCWMFRGQISTCFAGHKNFYTFLRAAHDAVAAAD